MQSICVVVREVTKKGYSFAYPTNNCNEPIFVKFTFLSHDDAKNVIKMMRITKKNYCMLLDELAIHKETYHCYYVGNNGLSLDEITEKMDDTESNKYLHSINDMKTNKVHLRTKARLHGLWKKCDTFDISDVATLKK